jgi:hypothetical protein
VLGALPQLPRLQLIGRLERLERDLRISRGAFGRQVLWGVVYLRLRIQRTHIPLQKSQEQIEAGAKMIMKGDLNGAGF